MASSPLIDNMQRLKTAKSNIASAITAKGGTVSGGGFEAFPSDIANIPTGATSVKMNSATYTPSSGVVNLGNVVLPTRTINGYALSNDITLGYGDVGAASQGHNHSGVYATSGHTHSNFLKTGYYTDNMSSGSLDNIKSEQRVYCTSNVTGGPFSSIEMMVEVLEDWSGSRITQRAEILSGTYIGRIYHRINMGSSWTSWIEVTPPKFKIGTETWTLSYRTWSQSAAGLYYSEALTPNTSFTELYSVTLCGWSSLRATDMLFFTIGRDSNKNKIGISANTNSFASGAYVQVKYFGIE